MGPEELRDADGAVRADDHWPAFVWSAVARRRNEGRPQVSTTGECLRDRCGCDVCFLEVSIVCLWKSRTYFELPRLFRKLNHYRNDLPQALTRKYIISFLLTTVITF